MSIWNYVVTAHKPTNVTHSCVGNFTSPHDLNLIIAEPMASLFFAWLMKHSEKQMNKDPEGYVPITIIASTKKIKSLVTKLVRISYPLLLATLKLHALVEYETSDIADKAVEKLNDERNWRKGMRVRLLLRCSPKSVLKSRKSEFDGYLDDDHEVLNSESAEDSSHPNNI